MTPQCQKSYFSYCTSLLGSISRALKAAALAYFVQPGGENRALLGDYLQRWTDILLGSLESFLQQHCTICGAESK